MYQGWRFLLHLKRHPMSRTSFRNYSSSSLEIGFIGLGNMGSGMAANLVKNGKSVVAFDTKGDVLKKQLADEMQGAGTFLWEESPAAVAARCSQIITMLPNNAIVRNVFEGPKGILESVGNGSILVDCSTVDPSISQELSHLCEKKDAIFVDAPVSGGVNAARAGSLTFMVGAKSTEDYEKVRPLLLTMGANVTHCGNVGMGGAVKICNNMLLAISMIGVSETMNLGINLGLDPKLLTSILSSATGRCWSMDTYNPVPGVMSNVPASNQYEGGFGSELMLKDLGLAQDAATRTTSSTPLGAAALHTYRIMCNMGYSKKDFSSAFHFLASAERRTKHDQVL